MTTLTFGSCMQLPCGGAKLDADKGFHEGRHSMDTIDFYDTTSEWENLSLRVWVVPKTRKPVGFELIDEEDKTGLRYKEGEMSFWSYVEEKSHFVEATPVFIEPLKPFNKMLYLSRFWERSKRIDPATRSYVMEALSAFKGI